MVVLKIKIIFVSDLCNEEITNKDVIDNSFRLSCS